MIENKSYINNQFIPYELELKLKDLGCNEFISYITYDPYPTENRGILWQQAFDWFREKHGLYCCLDPILNDYSIAYCGEEGINLIKSIDTSSNFNTFIDVKYGAVSSLIELCNII